MPELFECSTDNIGQHLKNIFEEDELDKNLTTQKISVGRKEIREYIFSMDEMYKRYLEETNKQ